MLLVELTAEQTVDRMDAKRGTMLDSGKVDLKVGKLVDLTVETMVGATAPQTVDSTAATTVAELVEMWDRELVG